MLNERNGNNARERDTESHVKKITKSNGKRRNSCTVRNIMRDVDTDKLLNT